MLVLDLRRKFYVWLYLGFLHLRKMIHQRLAVRRVDGKQIILAPFLCQTAEKLGSQFNIVLHQFVAIGVG